MSDKNTSGNQRLKILYLYRILLERSDEEHIITMPEIVSQLELYGISAGRKALYDDIEALKTYGLDIISVRGDKSGYYVGNRDFELPELKLLADAVSSSRFLTKKKSSELLKKIESLSSVYQAKQINRQVYIADRVKAMNERIYLNVDVIHRAIAENKQISFKYFDYDMQKRKRYRDGLRVCSPYALSWDDERYYLISFYPKRPDNYTNFRVDRMENVEILADEARVIPQAFNLSEYMNSTFSMFSGEAQEVKLRFHISLVNTVLDRFGKNISLRPDGDEYFTVRVNVKAEPPFFGWLFQFGTKASIVKPSELKDKYIEQLEDVLSSANKKEILL